MRVWIEFFYVRRLLEGLSLIENFVTAEEVVGLMKLIKPSKLNNISNGRNSFKRFGSDLPYKSRIVSSEIPQGFSFLLDRLVTSNLVPFRPDSITINEYLKGQGIAPHVDSKGSGEVISVLSLLSEATMVLTKHGEQPHFIKLPARSLVQMRDEVRWKWSHAIKPVAATRYSIVFRCSKENNEKLLVEPQES